MVYVGGKNGAGVYQTIINQMPPHDCYIEPFAGSYGVGRRKRPAESNVAIDLDANAGRFVADLRNVLFVQGDGIAFLERYRFRGRELVYMDPPYVRSTRATARDLYQFEMTDDDHERLLAVAVNLPCMVMVSGYPSDLYERALTGWRRITFQAMTRGGRPATEALWMNYPEPVALHDYQYLGEDYRERERIKRKVARWLAKASAMPATERQAILSALLASPDIAPPGSAGQESSLAADIGARSRKDASPFGPTCALRGGAATTHTPKTGVVRSIIARLGGAILSPRSTGATS